ncbi:MAG: Ivy family c-type lysozyme inhibitor [Methyloceanibacter sp.]|uniref:Ivy family c-type lysozyme inhibitor n=1 Tax=Methyloceanibacter sp. TaxID=1965321 RepID=UPI003D6D12AE
MLARSLLVLLLAAAAPALAEEPPKEPVPAGEQAKAPEAAAEKPKGPVLAELMKQSGYVYAWQSMVAGETLPQWVGDYVKTLDGPPIPTISVPLDGETYTLGFTCKANACETDQLYVLFGPGARDAWGLLVGGGGLIWLGKPDERIQQAILSVLE